MPVAAAECWCGGMSCSNFSKGVSEGRGSGCGLVARGIAAALSSCVFAAQRVHRGGRGLKRSGPESEYRGLCRHLLLVTSWSVEVRKELWFGHRARSVHPELWIARLHGLEAVAAIRSHGARCRFSTGLSRQKIPRIVHRRIAQRVNSLQWRSQCSTSSESEHSRVPGISFQRFRSEPTVSSAWNLDWFSCLCFSVCCFEDR